MHDGANILAIKEEGGWRPILKVKRIRQVLATGEYPTSCIVNGDQLFFPTQRQNDERIASYIQFLATFYNVPTIWGQLRVREDESYEEFWHEFFSDRGPRLPVAPVDEAEITLLAAGYTPTQGYFCHFSGMFPLFRYWRVMDCPEEGCTDDHTVQIETVAPVYPDLSDES
jgi:hypothetical protein